MIDWNGNRRIDPADIAISIALEQAEEIETEEYEELDEALDEAPLPAEKPKKPWFFERLFTRF